MKLRIDKSDSDAPLIDSPMQQCAELNRLHLSEEGDEYGVQAVLNRGMSFDSQTGIPFSTIPAANVATVPQRSPLRYPGGKTWLIPHVRLWLGSLSSTPALLVEPFAGGGIVSLTAVMEKLVDRCLIAELDRDVAAFWHAALRHTKDLISKVQTFGMDRHSVEQIENSVPIDVLEHGFRTLVLNRTRRGGILAPGASVSRRGENGKGVGSRWYPDTLANRLNAIERFADRISFCETDGLQLLESLLATGSGKLAIFVDPPYTVGGKRAGARLYAHSKVDHRLLFHLLATSGVEFLMTYDYAPEIIGLVREFDLYAVRVDMKNTHHSILPELLITSRPVFAPNR